MTAQAPPNAFYDAYWFLHDHPLFVYPGEREYACPISAFHQSLDLFVAVVNPETGAVDDDPIRNTRAVVLLEAGPWDGEESMWSHDPRLDIEAPSFEAAIIALAAAVRRYYRDDGTEIEECDAEE